jgi:hypothetical protein
MPAPAGMPEQEITMQLVINSQRHGTVRFWNSGPGGYIYVDGPEIVGRRDSRQICNGGEFRGWTLSAETHETFDRVVRRWWRAFLRRQAAGQP